MLPWCTLRILNTTITVDIETVSDFGLSKSKLEIKQLFSQNKLSIIAMANVRKISESMV